MGDVRATSTCASTEQPERRPSESGGGAQRSGLAKIAGFRCRDPLVTEDAITTTLLLRPIHIITSHDLRVSSGLPLCTIVYRTLAHPKASL